MYSLTCQSLFKQVQDQPMKNLTIKHKLRRKNNDFDIILYA